MNKNLLILASFSVLLLLSNCRKNDSESFDGPDLNDLFGPFQIIEEIKINKNTANFPVDKELYFTGKLSKNTDWKITFTGLTTGAKRTILGNEKDISISNSAWNGGANSFPGFGLENVSVAIEFPLEENQPILYDTLNITGLKTDEGTLITSFENGFGSTWSRFNQTTVSGGIVCNNGESAKGTCHYSFSGAVPWDWAVGSVMVKPSSGTTFGLQSNPNNLFFNMAFKPIENIGMQNTFIQFWFDEDDNGDGIFDESTEDRFIYEYWYQDTGWNLISYKYSDLQYDDEGNQTVTNGNGLPEPNKLSAINVFYLANKDNGNSKALIDHLIFTTNNSYNP